MVAGKSYLPIIADRTDIYSVFCHVRELGGVKSLVPGSKVSFHFEPDEKGGKAKQVVVEEAVEEVQEVREVCPFFARYPMMQADETDSNPDRHHQGNISLLNPLQLTLLYPALE